MYTHLRIITISLFLKVIVFDKLVFSCAVDSVVFCQMAPLQLSIYRHLLGSKLIGSCLRRDGDTSRHLECIGALRKVANSPGLVVAAARATVATEQELKRLNMRQSEV